MLLFILTKYLLIYHLPSTAWLQCYSVRRITGSVSLVTKPVLVTKPGLFLSHWWLPGGKGDFWNMLKLPLKRWKSKVPGRSLSGCCRSHYFFCYLKSCSYINQWEVKCFKGKNPQRYYRQFHNLFLHIRPPKPSWSYL